MPSKREQQEELHRLGLWECPRPRADATMAAVAAIDGPASDSRMTITESVPIRARRGPAAA
jgi:hypothetical protein